MVLTSDFVGIAVLGVPLPSAPLDVKVGDRVLLGKCSGTEVKIDGDDLLIMKESDILGIVD